MRSLQSVDDEITRVQEQTEQSRTKAMKMLADAADDAGLLVRDIDLTTLQAALAAVAVDHANAPLNRYGKRRQKLNHLALLRTRAAQQVRKEDDRAKYILGGFLLAQFRRSPEMLDEFAPLIGAYIARQEDEKVRVSDEALVSKLIELHTGTPGAEPSKADLRSGGLPLNRANRATIILGAFALVQMEEQPALTAAWRSGLDAFVAAADTAKAREVGRKTLIAVLGTTPAQRSNAAKC